MKYFTPKKFMKFYVTSHRHSWSTTTGTRCTAWYTSERQFWRGIGQTFTLSRRLSARCCVVGVLCSLVLSKCIRSKCSEQCAADWLTILVIVAAVMQRIWVMNVTTLLPPTIACSNQWIGQLNYYMCLRSCHT